MRSVGARRRILVAGLMAGAAGCTPFRDAPPPVDVRAVETQLGETVAPDDPYYQTAVRAISLRDYARALDYLQAARQKQPDDVRVLNAFGVVYDKLGRFDLSARYYSDAKKLDPASPIVAANQAYSAVLQAREYGSTVVPFEVANAAQPPPAGDSQMAPANPSSPAAAEQVTGAPAVLPGLPDSMQPAGSASAAVSLPVAAAVADARGSNLDAVPTPASAPVVPLAGIAAPADPAAVGAPLMPPEAGPSITIHDAITTPPTAVIVEPATRAANAVEPPAFPVVVSSAPIAIALPPIAATAVPANTLRAISQAPSPVAVNSAPPGIAEPPLPIGTPSVPSAAFASAALGQPASPLAPASLSVMPFAPSEKSADPDSAASAAARVPTPDIVPDPPRASTAPKFASALPPARRSVVLPVPAKKLASVSVETAAVKASAPKASPRPATEAIAAMPARTKHTKSAASNSPVASAVHRAPAPRAGSRVQVASAVIHTSSGTQAGTKSVTPQNVPPTKKLVLIGKPLFIINGSGRSGVSEPVRRRLASLRWTAPSWAVSDGAQQSVTTIRYAPIYFIVAHALARTLPFPSRLVACDRQCGGVSLILGRDLLKARFVKTAAVTTKRS